jgi:hypothetical protein
MKVIILPLLILFSSNLLAVEDANPCTKAPSSPKCQKYLNDLSEGSPCSADLVKFCIPKNKDVVKTRKDIKFDKTLKTVTVESMNECLNQNLKNLSSKCQESLELQSRGKCREKLVSNCMGFEGDKKIDCLAKYQIKDTDDCSR